MTKKQTNILNYRALSVMITGNKYTIRADYVPVKFQKLVLDIENRVQKVIDEEKQKHDEKENKQ